MPTFNTSDKKLVDSLIPAFRMAVEPIIADVRVISEAQQNNDVLDNKTLDSIYKTISKFPAKIGDSLELVGKEIRVSRRSSKWDIERLSSTIDNRLETTTLSLGNDLQDVSKEIDDQTKRLGKLNTALKGFDKDRVGAGTSVFNKAGLGSMMKGIGGLLTAPIMGPIIVGALAMGGMALVMKALQPWRDSMIADAQAERERIAKRLEKGTASEEGAKEALKEMKEEKETIKKDSGAFGVKYQTIKSEQKVQAITKQEEIVQESRFQRKEGTLDITNQIEAAKAKKDKIVGDAARKEASGGGFLGTGLFRSDKEKEEIAAIKEQAAKDAAEQDKIIKDLETKKIALEKQAATKKEVELIDKIAKLEEDVKESEKAKSKAFGTTYRTTTDEGKTKELQKELQITKDALKEEKKKRFGLDKPIDSTSVIPSKVNVDVDIVNATSRTATAVEAMAGAGTEKGSLYTHDITAEKQGEKLITGTEKQTDTTNGLFEKIDGGIRRDEASTSRSIRANADSPVKVASVVKSLSDFATAGLTKGSIYTHDLTAESQGEELISSSQDQSTALAESKDAAEKIGSGLYSDETAATVARVRARREARSLLHQKQIWRI